MTKSMRPALKQLKSIEYDHLNKIDNDVWEWLVSKPQNTAYVYGDSLHFIIKWCKLFGYPISYMSSYNQQLMMDQQHNLNNGEFEKSNPEQYSKFDKNLTPNFHVLIQ